MIVRKNLKPKHLIQYLWKPLLYFIIIASIVFICYEVFRIEEMRLPSIISSTLGTALAIFIGFRNSSAYDRWWEARKIWGGIVNYSRTFGRQITTLLTSQYAKDSIKPEVIKIYQRKMVYLHLGWINALRLQLRNQNEWNQIEEFILDKNEFDVLLLKKNIATQIIQIQATILKDLMLLGLIDDFRHMQIDNTLTELYNLQGKAERIKNTPLPRQYDYFINMFLGVFVTLLPFTLIESLSLLGIAWSVIPLSALISTCFYVVAAVAAYNEDPFENRFSDTPMTALCRTIEIDLKEQLKESKIPPKLEPIDGFLM